MIFRKLGWFCKVPAVHFQAQHGLSMWEFSVSGLDGIVVQAGVLDGHLLQRKNGEFPQFHCVGNMRFIHSETTEKNYGAKNSPPTPAVDFHPIGTRGSSCGFHNGCKVMESTLVDQNFPLLSTIWGLVWFASFQNEVSVLQVGFPNDM